MKEKKCPICGLINPDSGSRCDCGYDFETGIIKESYSSGTKRGRNGILQPFHSRIVTTRRRLIAVVVAIGFALVLVDMFLMRGRIYSLFYYSGIIFLLLLLGSLGGIVCAVIAKTKGRNGLSWFFYGVLLGPIGVILVLVLPKMEGEQFRKCPYCGELVKREAIKCRYCQSDLGKGNTGTRELEEDEELLADAPANLFRGIDSLGGQMKITNRRVLFEPRTVLFPPEKLQKLQKIPTEISLAQIAEVSRRNTWGIIPNGILIRTKSNIEYKFVVWSREQLINIIQNRLLRK